jgi:hypothetical protein
MADWFANVLDCRRGIDEAFRIAAEKAVAEQQRNVFPEVHERNWRDYFEWKRANSS